MLGPSWINDALDKVLDERGHRRIRRCCVSEEAAAELGRYAREHCGAAALVIADANTREAVGDEPWRVLRDSGKRLIELDFGSEELDASEELGRQVVDAAAGNGIEADFIVAVGSGTLSDLAKFAGGELGRPALLYATAASMNGYTSGIVALKVRGLKRTLPCTPAEAVFADPNVLAKAPQRMNAAGLADYLSKCSSAADWRAAHFLRDEHYAADALQFYDGVLDQIFDAAEAVGAGEGEAAALLFEALLLSGLSMLAAGSSAPASGGEHLISHFIDMKAAIASSAGAAAGARPLHDLHGAQVGVGTLHCLQLWERVLAWDPEQTDASVLAQAQPSIEEVEALVREDWPPQVAEEVMAQWRQKSRSRSELAAEIQLLAGQWEAFCGGVREDLRSAEAVRAAIAAAGGPTKADELTTQPEYVQQALKTARFIRNRFTVLDLAAELGVGR